MVVNLKNSVTRQVKQTKVGFSWTTFFFGPLPSLFRMDWVNCFIMIGAAFLTMGISWIVFPFVYNRMYIAHLLRKGFVPAAKQDQDILLSKGMTSPDPIE